MPQIRVLGECSDHLVDYFQNLQNRMVMGRENVRVQVLHVSQTPAYIFFAPKNLIARHLHVL